MGGVCSSGCSDGKQMDGLAQSPKQKSGNEKNQKLSLEEFQEEVQRQDSVEHVNLLLERHCENCRKGCNDVAPPTGKGKIRPWSTQTDRCQIYAMYTTKDDPEDTRCREGKAMNKIVMQLKEQDNRRSCR